MGRFGPYGLWGLNIRQSSSLHKTGGLARKRGKTKNIIEVNKNPRSLLTKPIFGQFPQTSMQENASLFVQFQPPKTPKVGSSEVRTYERKSHSKSRPEFPIFSGKELQG